MALYPGLDYLIKWYMRAVAGPLSATASVQKWYTLQDANSYWVSQGRPNQTMNGRLLAFLRFAWDAEAPTQVRLAVAGTPGAFYPATAPIPSAAELQTMFLVKSPMTPWPVGQYVVTSDGKSMSWTGFDWVEVSAPPADDYIAVVMADAPVAFWPFGDVSGTDATDIAEGAHNGAYLSAAVPEDVSLWTPRDGGPIGDNLIATLNTTRMVEVPGFAWGIGDFAAEAWFFAQPVTFAGFGYVIRTEAPGGSFLINLHLIWDSANVRMTAHRRNEEGVMATIHAPMTGGAWRHVVYVKEGATLSLYIDGALAGTTPAPLGTFNAPTLIHIGNDPGGAPLGAGILMHALYDHALSAAQVLAHYEARLL